MRFKEEGINYFVHSSFRCKKRVKLNWRILFTTIYIYVQKLNDIWMSFSKSECVIDEHTQGYLQIFTSKL